MRDLVTLFVHVIATLARLLGPGGIRSVVAESVLIKQQLLILNRSRQRSPNLRSSDRLVAGLCALIRPARLIRSAVVLKPSNLLSLHRTQRNRKYRLLFSSKRRVQRDRPENSSKPLSKPNSAIRPGAVRELLSRLLWLSTSQSTRTMAERIKRAGRMRRAHKPATRRSEERRLGAR